VSSLVMSPKEDLFASAAADDTARLWDLRVEKCLAALHFEGGGRQPCVGFDPHGLVLAAAVCGSLVKLFDVRAYSTGPFATFSIDKSLDFANIKFSHDGKLMLMGTAQGAVVSLDAFSGDVLQTYSGHDNTQGLPLSATFSPDASHVLCGSEDGALWRWNTLSGQALPSLTGHSAPVTTVVCNPTRMLLASACSTVNLWLSTAPAS